MFHADAGVEAGWRGKTVKEWGCAGVRRGKSIEVGNVNVRLWDVSQGGIEEVKKV